MRLAYLAIVVVLAFAGCTSDQNPPPSPSTDDPTLDDPSPNAPQWQRANHTATVTVKVRDDNGDHGRNCVFVSSEEDQYISNVTATATWDNDLPTNLFLIYWEAPSARNVFTNGSSPLHVDVPEPKLRPDGKGLSLFAISVEPAIGHTVPEMQVQVDLAFDHEPEQPVEFRPGSCDVQRYIGPV